MIEVMNFVNNDMNLNNDNELCCLFARVEYECNGVTGDDITFYTCSVPKKVKVAKKVNGTMCNTQSTVIENEVAFIGINYQEVAVEVSVIMGIPSVQMAPKPEGHT